MPSGYGGVLEEKKAQKAEERQKRSTTPIFFIFLIEAMISFFSLSPQSFKGSHPQYYLHNRGKLLSFVGEMINYIQLYRIRKRVKKILKDKILEGELATTETSCLGCVADDISWEVYYLIKESKSEKDEKT